MNTVQLHPSVKAFYYTLDGKKVMDAWAEQAEQISTLWLLRTQFIH